MPKVLDPCTLIRVQTWDLQAAVPPAAERSLGIAWPRETGTVARGRAEVLCIGPTDWLVIAIDSDPAALLQQLAQAFRGSTFRASDVSQALTRIEIDDPEARMLLSKGCALDMHPSRFPPGRCARTRFAGMPAIVRCARELTFECIVATSFRDYLFSWLSDAGREFSEGCT
jgi:sarcosine oxidase subunit gamma